VKKSLKTHIFGVQGRSSSSMLVPLESSSAVLLMIRSKSVSICNHSRARLVDSSRNRTYWRGYPNLMRSYGGLLESRGSSLTDGQTDGQTDRRTELRRARLSRVKAHRRKTSFECSTSVHIV